MRALEKIAAKVITLKGEGQRLLAKIIKNKTGEKIEVTRMGGPRGRNQEFLHMVQEFRKGREKDGALYTAKIIKEKVERPLQTISKWDRLILDQVRGQ